VHRPGGLEEFEQAARVIIAARRVAGTREVYTHHLRFWTDFCRFVNIDPMHVTLADAVLFRDQLQSANPPRRPKTINLSLVVCSTIYKALTQQGLVQRNPFAATVLPRPRDQAVEPAEYISRADYDAMLAAAKRHPQRNIARRWTFLLHLCWTTGWRRSEIATLEVESFIVGPRDQPHAHLRVKGGKWIDVPVSVALVEAVKTYCAEAGITTGRIFPHFTGNALYYVVTACAARAKIPRRIHPHAFRATAITDALEDGNVLDVKELFGHENVATTQLYDRNNMRGVRAMLLLEAHRNKGRDAEEQKLLDAKLAENLAWLRTRPKRCVCDVPSPGESNNGACTVCTGYTRHEER